MFRPYSREKAVFPVSTLRKSKFWPSVSRVDDGKSRRLALSRTSPLKLESCFLRIVADPT
jgi:glycine dehydrogenase